MGLLHVLGLEPPGSPAVPGAGGRQFAPIRVTLSRRGTIRETLVSSTLATTAVQGDVSSRLTRSGVSGFAVRMRFHRYGRLP